MPQSDLSRLLRKLDIELLGAEADAKEAYGLVRYPRAEKDLADGLQAARGTLDQLLAMTVVRIEPAPVSEVTAAE